MLAAAGGMIVAGTARPGSAWAATGLRAQALGALERHQANVLVRDRIAIVDFSRPSREARFEIFDLASGKSRLFLVAHGKGSDPAHKGWLERFSNVEGSEATSAGAFVTGDIYVGQHGRSRRLKGLEPTNSNAEARAIVIHGADYVGAEVIARQGKLGRSQGCFAFAPTDIEDILAAIGPGRLIYAGRS